MRLENIEQGILDTPQYVIISELFQHPRSSHVDSPPVMGFQSRDLSGHVKRFFFFGVGDWIDLPWHEYGCMFWVIDLLEDPVEIWAAFHLKSPGTLWSP